jgi:hypothetical protein
LVHRNVIQNRCDASLADFADPVPTFRRKILPENWNGLGDQV